jgi:hypothetical protein
MSTNPKGGALLPDQDALQIMLASKDAMALGHTSILQSVPAQNECMLHYYKLYGKDRTRCIRVP